MTLPQKEYYYLSEVMERWKLAGFDIRYYAEHGLLEVQAWLNEAFVKIFRDTMLADGTTKPVLHTDVSTYKGYAIVVPDELRKIFSASPQPVVMFKHPATRDTLKIHYKDTPPIIGIEDLVICKAERNRFEEEYSVEVHCCPRAAAAHTAPSAFSGRPSVMRLIEQEFSRRCADGSVEPSLQKESDALEIWIAEKAPGVQTPKSKAIMNALRAKYRAHKLAITAPLEKPTQQATT